ncbi:MAG: pyruvate formate lyase family protein [Candidatus Bathyarchaeia archaeon]
MQISETEIMLKGRLRERIERLISKIRKEKFPLCVEKARLITESWEQTEGEPEIIRGAKAWAHVLDNIPIFIDDDEMIVGEGASKPWGVEIDPFLGIWNEDEIKGAEEEGLIIVDEKDWSMIRELGKYWMKKCSEYKRSCLYDEKLSKFLQIGITLPPIERKEEFRGAYAGSGLCLSFNFTDCWQDIERWLNGLNSIIAEIENELNNLRILTFEDLEKKIFLEAAKIVLKAIIRFANRYADLAEKLASEEKDPVRKQELLKIAEACRWVPANKPRSFYEAVQSVWFNQILSTPTSTYNFGRFDQYMYPYYKNDIKNGKITNEEVLALLCELRIKCMKPENIKLRAAKRMQHEGFAKWRNMTIGGVTPDGKDATNELTYLVLEAAKIVKTPHHTITLRVHEGTPEDLMVKALEVVKTGIGMPAFASDPSFIAYLTSGGIPLEEARNYHIAGCLDPSVPGKLGCLAGRFFVVPKVLEIFMNGGVDPRTGIELCPFKVNVEDFNTFDEFYSAFKQYLSYFINLWHEQVVIESYDTLGCPSYYDAVEIIETVLLHDGIRVGKPLSKRRAVPPYNFRAVMIPVGLQNVVDSLAVIKKLVFEEKKVTMRQLKETLAVNWQGHEELRKICLKAPKYGNDYDYVDSIAADLLKFLIDEVGRYPNVARPVGGIIRGLGGASISSMWAGGAITGATPDGRCAGEPLADGTVSPVQGRDINGPTAVLKSALKVDQVSCSSTLLNMKFHPSTLKTTEDLRKLAALIKTYFIHGGKWIQFNVVGRETLLEAQKHPEKYRDLIVRVAGYSAYFTQLSRGVQDDIIRRTEHITI